MAQKEINDFTAKTAVEDTDEVVIQETGGGTTKKCTVLNLVDDVLGNGSVDAATLTGNVAVGGTLAVTGTSTLTGNVTASGTLAVTGASTLTGALAANGGITCDTNKFTVADTSGNTAIAGTLDVTGATTVTGLLSANGGFACDTNKFTVSDTSGNTSIAGTLTVTGATTLNGATSTHKTVRTETSSYAATVGDCKGTIILCSTANPFTLTLPAVSNVSSGGHVIAHALGGIALRVQPNASDRIVLNGTAAADNEYVVSSTAGASIHLVKDSADGWTAFMVFGSWAEATP